jgi:hypothetical protein
MGTKAFTYKMALHPTTIEMSGCTWMKLYLDDGKVEEVLLSFHHGPRI